MARVIIREQDLTGNIVNQDFTDIAFIPGFVKYPKEDYVSPQLCYSEAEFIDMFGNEPALAFSEFNYNVTYTADGQTRDVLNPETGTEVFYLGSNDVESLSDCAYHYARELLYRGLPIYYGPMNAKDENGKMKTYDGTQNLGEAKFIDITPSVIEDTKYTSSSPLVLSNDGRNYTFSISNSRKIYIKASTKTGYTAAYKWYVNGSLQEGKTSQTFNYDVTENTVIKCLTTFTKQEGSTASGPDEEVIDSYICVGLNSNNALLTVLPKGSSEALSVSTQPASEKFNISADDDEFTGFITAGVKSQVVSYNQQVTFTVQVEGTNVKKFNYVWCLKDADDENAKEIVKSTNQICKFSSGDTDIGPGHYQVIVYITADKSIREGLDPINIEKTGADLTTSQIIAEARARAIEKATEKINNQFLKEMLDFFCESDNIELLKDRGLYNFKYFTTGGYPLFESGSTNNTSDGNSTAFDNWNKALTNLLSICGQKTTDDAKDYITEDGSTQRQGRGDCVLLIDHTYDKAQDTMDLYSRAREWFEDPSNVSPETLEFAAMFTPWCNYSMTYTSHNVNLNLPASFAYLTCLADSIQAYDNWHAIAGVTRGSVKNINEVLLTNPLTNTKANKCQADPETAEKGRISINCITEIKPYGQVIWGNRTLQRADAYKHVTAMGFLNLRNEVSDIKKLVYRAARRWMFEQNTSILWINFKSTITPLLERMVHGYGLSRYEIRRGEKTAKHKLYAEIRIWPIYAVEYIDVTIQILDEETIVTEE